MATIQEKKIVKVSSEQWTGSETWTNNKGEEVKGNYTEVPVMAVGSKGEEQIVLRTGSQKLLDALKPDVMVHGYVFKDANAAKFPDAWRINAMAKDNPQLVEPYSGGAQSDAQGGTGGSGGPQQPQESLSGAEQGDGKGYSFDELVVLFAACYREAKKVHGDVSDDVLQRATATMFMGCTEYGVTIGGGKASDSSMNENMSEKLMAEIIPAIKDADLFEKYENSSVPDADIIRLWTECGANPTKFVMRLVNVLGADDGAGGGASTETGDGETERLPF